MEFWKKRKILLTIFVAINIFQNHLHSFDKVVIWGHKLHSHTHSYIHAAFFKAFQHMGYSVYWLDEHDDIDLVDFTNSLFITEGQVDKNIPLRDDSLYVLHNCNFEKYNKLPQEHVIILQVYTDDVISRTSCEKVSECIYYDLNSRVIYMPWATDLLPDEIDTIRNKGVHLKKSKKIFWVGTIGGGDFGNIGEITPFIEACRESGVTFEQKSGISEAKAMDVIKRSYMAPTIVGNWQKEKGYIPCRIFKNISYGQLGVTNSYRVYELFNKKIVYNSDTKKLFYDAKKRLKEISQSELDDVINFVRDNHTYINRIEQLFDFFEKVEASKR